MNRKESWIYAFDLDDTLLNFNSSIGFYKYHFLRRRFGLRSLFACLTAYCSYRFFSGDMRRIYSCFFETCLKGMSFEKLLELVDQWIDNLKPNFYQPSLNYLNHALSEGFPVVILSSSPDFLVSRFARLFKVSEFSASVYACNSEGIYREPGLFLDGHGKARELRRYMRYFNVTKSLCFSNSVSDLPFLFAGTKSIAVKADRKFKKFSLCKGWVTI
ncbi:MAG: haloacid dehalogenase-like hydrolase [Victivallaceae bacterium]